MNDSTRYFDENSLVLKVDSTVYSRESLLRACYKFTDRFYIFLIRSTSTPEIILATFAPRSPDQPVKQLVGEFYNELIDQNIRQDLREETRDIRTLIVAQAFSEGNLLESDAEEKDYADDPLGIARR